MNNAAEEEMLEKIDILNFRKEETANFDYQSLAASFLRTLIYFDVFSYPLRQQEIFEYSSERNFNSHEGRITIEKLLEQGLINSFSGYYFMGNNNAKVKQRISGNKLAEKRMKSARFFSNIIASFPFIRGVYISGSLSKGFMDETSDIDYFILTSPNRLWLSRTLLILFKKIFLFNSHKNFCINYLVDTDNLEITDRNIYTATEVALLLPMHNYQLYNKFLEVNNWYKEYYPNFRHNVKVAAEGFPLVRNFFERILNNKFGDILDNYFYKITVKFWNAKHLRIDNTKPKNELKWSKQVSQYHPRHYQFNVLKKFQKKIHEIELLAGFPIGDC